MVFSRNLRGDRRSGLVHFPTFFLLSLYDISAVRHSLDRTELTAYAATYLVFKKASAFVCVLVLGRSPHPSICISGETARRNRRRSGNRVNDCKEEQEGRRLAQSSSRTLMIDSPSSSSPDRMEEQEEPILKALRMYIVYVAGMDRWMRGH